MNAFDLSAGSENCIRSLERNDSMLQNHKLNGSSSPVLTATSLSYGEAKNSTLTESKPLT